MSTTSSSQTSASSTAVSTQDSYDDSKIASNISNESLVGIVVQCSPNTEPTVQPLPVQFENISSKGRGKKRKQQDGKWDILSNSVNYNLFNHVCQEAGWDSLVQENKRLREEFQELLAQLQEERKQFESRLALMESRLALMQNQPRTVTAARSATSDAASVEATKKYANKMNLRQREET